MPLVRMTTSVACDDLPGVAGEEVTLPPERAQQVVAAGWGELVREDRAERPERPEQGFETASTRRRQRTRG